MVMHEMAREELLVRTVGLVVNMAAAGLDRFAGSSTNFITN